MATLATLEGETNGELLDRLFDCNDVLGVTIYGPETWNKLKSYAANLALKLLTQNPRCIDRSTVYRSKHDVIDQALGFNDSLGVELLGAESWGHYVNSCKLAAPTLGYDFVSNLLVNPAKRAVQSLTPEDLSARGLIEYATGVRQVKSALDTAKDVTGYTESKETAAYKRAKEAALESLKQKQTEAQEEYNRLAEQAEADRQAQIKIEAAKAESEYKTARDTNPDYLAAKTTNYFIWGSVALVAVYLISRGDK